MIWYKLGQNYFGLFFSVLFILFIGGGCAGIQSAIRAAPVLKNEQPSMEQSLARLSYVERAANLSNFYMTSVPIGPSSEWPDGLSKISKNDLNHYYDRLHCKGPYAVVGRFILPLAVLVEKFEEIKRGLGTAGRVGDYASFFDAFVDLTGNYGIEIKKRYDAWMTTVVNIGRLESTINELDTKKDKKIERLKTILGNLEETADKQFDALIPLIEALSTRKELVSRSEKMALAKKLHTVSLNVSNLQTEAALTVMISLVQFGRAAPNAPGELISIVNRWKEEMNLNLNVGTVEGVVASGGFGNAVAGAADGLKEKAGALLEDALLVPSRIGQLGSALRKSKKFNSTIADSLGMLTNAPLYKAIEIDLQAGVFQQRPGNCSQILTEYSAALAAANRMGGDVVGGELEKPKTEPEPQDAILNNKNELHAKKAQNYRDIVIPTVEVVDNKIVGKYLPAMSADGERIVYLAVFKRADGDSFTAKFSVVSARNNDTLHEEVIVEEGSFVDFTEVKGKVVLQAEKINKYLAKDYWFMMKPLYQYTAKVFQICKQGSFRGSCMQIIDIGGSQLIYDEPNLTIHGKVRKMRKWRDKGYCAYPKKLSASSSRCKTVCRGSSFIASLNQALDGETLLIRVEHDVQGDFCEGTAPRYQVMHVVKRVKEMGTLSLMTTPWSEVYIDGELIGNTPIIKHPLEIGTHTVTMQCQNLNLEKEITVTIGANEETKLVHNLVQQ